MGHRECPWGQFGTLGEQLKELFLSHVTEKCPQSVANVPRGWPGAWPRLWWQVTLGDSDHQRGGDTVTVTGLYWRHRP